MCAVSAVMDYGMRHPPWQFYPPTVPSMPMAPPQPFPDPEAAEALKKFMKMVEAAKEFDAASKQPDCEDPKKMEFMKQVLDRLDAIEKRLQSL